MTDDNDKPILTRRRVLGGMATIGAAGAAGAGSWAAFSDESEPLDATLEAGKIEGSMEYTASYNGNEVDETLTNVNVPSDVVGDGVEFALTDVKPGDRGSITLDISVNGNPAWVAACLDISNSQENERSGVEKAAGNDTSGGELEENVQIIPFYSPNVQDEFFDFDGPDDDYTDGNMDQYGEGTSAAFWNSREGFDNYDEVQPLTLKEAQRTAATDTAHFGEDSSQAPEGTTVDDGCILLDGSLAGNEETGDDGKGVKPLYAESTLKFGYDWHLPFTVGNEAQTDSVKISIGTVFKQYRSSAGPYMPNVFAVDNNTPN